MWNRCRWRHQPSLLPDLVLSSVVHHSSCVPHPPTTWQCAPTCFPRPSTLRHLSNIYAGLQEKYRLHERPHREDRNRLCADSQLRLQHMAAGVGDVTSAAAEAVQHQQQSEGGALQGGHHSCRGALPSTGKRPHRSRIHSLGRAPAGAAALT